MACYTYVGSTVHATVVSGCAAIRAVRVKICASRKALEARHVVDLEAEEVELHLVPKVWLFEEEPDAEVAWVRAVFAPDVSASSGA